LVFSITPSLHYSITPELWFFSMTLHIHPIMNSAVEDIFAFKTCCGVRVFDQNLEFLITNKGERPIRVPSYFDMEEESGLYRVDTLLPHGDQAVAPGRTVAFYCTMDEVRWEKVRQVVFYDTEGNRYAVKIRSA
jgi:hypothetical protein